MVEQRNFNIEEHNAAQQHALQQEFKQMTERIGMIWDIDETVVDTIGNHTKLITRGASMLGYKDPLPSREEIISQGGTSAYAELFGLTPQEWESRMERIRDSKYVNSGADMYHPEVAQLLPTLEDTKLLGFVTARPGSEKTLLVTEEDLFNRVGLPKRPVILRPESVSLADTSSWKLAILKQIAQQDDQKRVVLIDDSISTAKTVMEYNSRNGENPIIQVIYKGPLTKPLIDNGDFQINTQMGIYTADWQEMPTIMNQIQQQW